MVRPFANCIVPILSLTMLAGCSPNYLPIGDHKVFIDTFVLQGDVGGMTHALFCTADESICGRRETEDYDPDAFRLDTTYNPGLGITDMPYFWTAAKERRGDMQAGIFEVLGVDPNAGHIMRTSINDLAWAEAVVPPHFTFVAPDYFSELSRKAIQTLDVTWAPSHQGFPVIWDLFLADREAEEMPCDLLGWKGAKGEAEDTGSLQIPLDGLPEELPAEGCDAVLVVRLRSEGTLPPEFPHGYVRSEMLAGVVFRFMP